MTKASNALGDIVFQCRCLNTELGMPDDTLMAEEYLETGRSDLKHNVFIKNAAHDTAANIVLKDCPNCRLNFMTRILIGTQESTLYTCTCGKIYTNEEYMQALGDKK
jgi:hypothetical protein